MNYISGCTKTTFVYTSECTGQINKLLYIYIFWKGIIDKIWKIYILVHDITGINKIKRIQTEFKWE